MLSLKGNACQLLEKMVVGKFVGERVLRLVPHKRFEVESHALLGIIIFVERQKFGQRHNDVEMSRILCLGDKAPNLFLGLGSL